MTGSISIAKTITYDNVNYSVTAIKSYAFYGSRINEIFIPNSIEQIGIQSFYNCNRLKRVIIEDGDNELDFLSSSKSSFGNDDDDDLSLEYLYLGRNLSYISGYPFANQLRLSKVEIGSQVTVLPHNLFYNDQALTEVTIPGSIDSIGRNIFSFCYNLRELKGLAENKNIRTIPPYTFRNCSSLTKVDIPEQVGTIGDHAFYNCENIREIVLKSGLTTVSSCAFDRCFALRKLIIEDANSALYFENIISNCFDKAPLDTIYIGRNLTRATTDYTMFAQNQNLKTVTLGNCVTRIIDCMFYGCTGLKEIIIPKGITNIDGFSFDGCTNLRSVVFEESSKNLEINNRYSECFDDIPLEKIVVGRNISFAVGNNLPFCNNAALKEITLNGGISKIFEGRFTGCTNIESITLDADVSINSGTNGYFTGFDKLTNIYIGTNVTKIASRLFTDCKNIKLVQSKAATPPILEDYNFTGAAFDVMVPAGSEMAYRKTKNWFSYRIFSDNEAPVEITLNDTLHLSDCGALTDSIGNMKITGKMVEEDWKAILSMRQLSEIDLSSADIAEIPDSVFIHSALRAVTLPKRLQKIGKYAFYNCHLLKIPADMPRTLTSVGAYAFANCTAIDSVTFTGHINLAGAAFYNCSGLSKVTINDSYIDPIDTVCTNSFTMSESAAPVLDTIYKNDRFVLPEDSFPEFEKKTMTIDSLMKVDISCDSSFVLPYRQEFHRYVMKNNKPAQEITDYCMIDSTIIQCDTVLHKLDSITITNRAGAAYNDSTMPYRLHVDSLFYISHVDTIQKRLSVKDSLVEGIYDYLPDLTIVEGLHDLNILLHADTAVIVTVDSVKVSIRNTDYYRFKEIQTDTAWHYSTWKYSTSTYIADRRVIKSETIDKEPVVFGNFSFAGTALTTMKLPENITSIGEGIVKNCPKMTSFAMTGENAFYTVENNILLDKSKTKIVAVPANLINGPYLIGDNISDISAYAFSGVAGMSSLSIPVSVTSIGSYAFENCDALVYVDAAHETPLVISSNVFKNVYNHCMLNTPTPEAAESYKVAEGWKEFMKVTNISTGIDAANSLEPEIEVNEEGMVINAGGNHRQVAVYSIIGELVYRTEVQSRPAVIPRDTFKKGIYIVKIENVSKKIYIQ